MSEQIDIFIEDPCCCTTNAYMNEDEVYICTVTNIEVTAWVERCEATAHGITESWMEVNYEIDKFDYEVTDANDVTVLQAKGVTHEEAHRKMVAEGLQPEFDFPDSDIRSLALDAAT